MELKLAENIRSFRKNKKMTQEQLAETLGITVGAVSKWESAATTPEIGMIMRLAELFDTSVDVLVGYQLQSGALEQVLAQIKQFREERLYDEAIRIGEKALQKFPNNFDVVYQTALSHLAQGFGDRKYEDSAIRAQELLRRSLELFDQNTDPEISLWLVKNQLGESYMRWPEKALEIFQENNFNGINDARIAQLLSDVLKQYDEAMPYAKRAFRKMTEDLVSSMVALISAYEGKKQFDQGEECHNWLIKTLESMEPDEGFSELTWSRITLIQSQAEILYKHRKREEAKECMLYARRLAKAYDETPNEEIRISRFFDGRRSDKFYLDMNYDTMAEYLESRLHWNTKEEYPDYYALWDEVTKELENE